MHGQTPGIKRSLTDSGSLRGEGMENIQKSLFTKISNELMFFLVLGFIVILAASSYSIFESVVSFVENHNSKGLGLLLVLSIYVSLGMGILSLKKWREHENTLALYREAEDELKEKDRMYRALFEQSSDAVIISDGKKVLDINKKGCEIFGFGQKRPFNMSLMSFIPGEYLPELQQAIMETFKRGSSYIEMTYNKPEGEIIDIKVSLLLIDRKENIIQIVVQDFTYLKCMGRSEQESREKLKTILENTFCGILLIEASSRKIVDANPVALKTSGYSNEELIGMICHKLIGQPGEEKCTPLPLDQTGDLSESVLFKATGEALPILRSIVPVSIEETGYFVESFIDISTHKQAEEELLQGKLAAEDANRAMNEFLATMSHELRTPLTSIIGFSDLMLGGTTGEFDDLNKKFLGNISSSGKHILSLTNSILDLSRIEAGKIELQLAYFSLQEIFTDTKSILFPLAMQKKISMNFDVESGFYIYADRMRFKQIMYNLVSNAIKLTPAGGSIEVRGSASEKRVRVSVSDTGIGISKEEMKQLFKPFKQIDSALSCKYESSKLGLALSKKFVEMHGGRIWAESEPGKGSTFTFEVPVKVLKTRESISLSASSMNNGVNIPATPASAEEEIKPETEGLAEKSEEEILPVIFEPEGSDGSEPLVMVVEDDKLSRELLVFTLTEAGYRVAQAATGKEALSFAQKLKPFVITLDLVLPEMNGWEVLENLKKDRETAGIPVIIISINDTNDCNMLAGAVEHLVKPIERPVLLSTLERLKKKTEYKAPKILVADAQDSMLEFISSMIESEGYVISQAHGGKEAIEKALLELPAVIILDLTMPDLSGFELIETLKKNPETMAIPIIVCSSKDLSMEEMKMLNSNVSFVMQKQNLSKQILLELINNVIHDNRRECIFSNSQEDCLSVSCKTEE
jgi:PAS domain S-box-containing protein